MYRRIWALGRWQKHHCSTAKKRLENREEKEEVQLVEFDVWKYSGESLQRKFLDELAKQLPVKRKTNFYETQTTETLKFNLKSWDWIPNGLAFIGLIILSFFFPSDKKTELLLPWFLAFAANVIALWKSLHTKVTIIGVWIVNTRKTTLAYNITVYTPVQMLNAEFFG